LPSFQQFKEKIDRNSPTSKDVDSTDNMYGLQMEGYADALSGYITYGLVDNFEDIKYETGLITNTYNYNIFSGFLTYHDGIGRKFDYDLKYKYSVMTARGSGLDRTLDNNSVGLDTKYRFGLDNYLFASADLSYKFPTITNLAQARNS
jgi:hypothetical protein